MTRLLVALLAAALALGASVAAAASAARAGTAARPSPSHALADDGWPETGVGDLARRWTQAFSKGEKAMREALPQLLTAESLAKRDMESRMVTYRSMRERFGALMLAKVDSSGVGELKVTLAGSDLGQHVFVFTADPGPPLRLARISMVERRSGGHGGHGH